MSTAATAAAIARELLAECGTPRAALDYLIDQRIDCRTEAEAERLEMLIAAVERANLH